MSDFDQKTIELKAIITKVKKSAKQAWKAGEYLLDIWINKSYIKKYKDFKSYANQEFNITESTAENYIKIYQKIPLDMITDNMLVSHLYTITEMQDDLKIQLLKTMRWAEENLQLENKLPYDGNTVLIIKQIIESTSKDSKISNDILNQIFKEVLNQDVKDSKRKARDKRNPLEEAIPIDELTIHTSFQKVSSIYSYAPISEQGLVGLFCTIFHILREKTIDYEGHKYNFSKIIYVRVEFPDAKIELKRKYLEQQIISGNNLEELAFHTKHLDIEFELDSFNYWRHKHHEATEKCDMIICWKIGKTFEKINMPPILSIRELLETGKITLHYSNI